MRHMDKKNLVRHELIGLEAEVIAGTHLGYVGIHGKIVDETKKMLTLAHKSAEKQVPKEAVTLLVRLPDGSLHTVEGRDLVHRPIERVKKRRRRR